VILVYSGVTGIDIGEATANRSHVIPYGQAIGIGISNREHSRDLDFGVGLEMIEIKFKLAEHQNHTTFSSLQVLDANAPSKAVVSSA
jgi:hypothetical protein